MENLNEPRMAVSSNAQEAVFEVQEHSFSANISQTAKFGHVVVETAAAPDGADSTVTASKCGPPSVIARKYQPKVVALQDLVGTFEQTSAKLIGVIVDEL